eukprot:g11849.t1
MRPKTKTGETANVQEQVAETYTDGWKNMMTQEIVKNKGRTCKLIRAENRMLSMVARGWCSFLLAVRNGHTEVVRLLVKPEHAQVKTPLGRTPIQCAQKYGHRETEELLRSLWEHRPPSALRPGICWVDGAIPIQKPHFICRMSRVLLGVSLPFLLTAAEHFGQCAADSVDEDGGNGFAGLVLWGMRHQQHPGWSGWIPCFIRLRVPEFNVVRGPITAARGARNAASAAVDRRFSLLQTSLSVSHTEPRRSLLTHVVDDLGRRGANASSPLALVGAGSARSSTRDIIAWPGACVLSVSFAVTLIFVVVLWTVMLEARDQAGRDLHRSRAISKIFMGALFVMELLLQRFTLTLSQLSHRHQAHQASKALAPRGAMAGGPGLANYRSGAGTGSQAEDQGLGRPTRIPGEVQRTLTPPSFGVRKASRPMVPHICPSLSLLQGACQFRIPVQSLELLQAGYFPTQILSPTGNPLLHAWLPLCQKTPQTGPPAQDGRDEILGTGCQWCKRKLGERGSRFLAQLGHLLQLTTTAALSRHPHASIGLLTVGAKEQKAEIFGPKNLKYGSLVRSNDKWLVYHHHEGSEQLALTLHHMPAALGFCARAAEGHEVASATRIAGGSGEVLSITINPGGDALLALLCFLAVVLSMLETVVVPNEAPPVPPPAALPPGYADATVAWTTRSFFRSSRGTEARPCKDMKVTWRDQKCQVSTSFSTIELEVPETPPSCGSFLPGLPDTPVRKTVFLVRHGEALHNIAEKLALKEAQEALKDEEPPNEELKREALEIARRSALTDEGLKDAPLSTKGHEQAEITAANVSKIIREEELKAPEAVFVSPLQRALQTAARMFPEHQEVHVCDLLRERCTGFPCDERRHERRGESSPPNRFRV